MPKKSLFLCFLLDNPEHQALCNRYWATSEGAWSETFDAIQQDAGVTKRKLLELLQTGCVAYLLHFRCDVCGTPFQVRNRSGYSPQTGRPAGFSNCRLDRKCQSCNIKAIAAERKGEATAIEQHRTRVLEKLFNTRDESLTIDYKKLSYIQSFFLYSVLVAANAGWQENKIAPLETQPGELAPTPELAEHVYNSLHEDKILSVDPASDPLVFTFSDLDGTVNFSLRRVSWIIRTDASGSPMDEIFIELSKRLSNPEQDAIEAIWFMVAESECRGYFLKECNRYRFVKPDIFSAKVSLVVRDFLLYFSIGQIWNVIHYTLKDLAAKSQEKAYARQHLYNMIPGNLRRSLDYHLATKKSIYSWRRPALMNESWMSSILFDKVIGNGDVSFQTLTGQSIGAHVEFKHLERK